MTRKEKILLFSAVTDKLKELYPNAACTLEYNGEPWKLLVMGQLSAQCTDARVNAVCRELFEKYPNAKALAEGNLNDIENIVKPCGLFRTKSSNIKASCAMLVSDYGGTLPSTAEELLKFPGVGRKIANLLLGDIYKLPAIVADTHCIRICGRLGAYSESNKDAQKTEKIMSSLVVPEEQSDFCHRIVQFGREFCTARSPKCDDCPLNTLCVGRRKY